jgi:uncharacterized membrane protein
MRKSLDWGQIISIIAMMLFLAFGVFGLVDTYKYNSEFKFILALWWIIVVIMVSVLIHLFALTIKQFRSREYWRKTHKTLSQELNDMDMFQIDKPDIV